MFNYKFPVITHIDQVRSAIEGRDEFREIVKGDYTVFNYLVNFEDTFPPVIKVTEKKGTLSFLEPDINAAIRRECRGLIFDTKSGKLIRRPFHKFFNLNEKPETLFGNIDFPALPHVILEKLDGSMIAPFQLDGSDEILWGTKMGVTDVAENARAWVAGRDNYMEFVKVLLRAGNTPIFEWCSRKNRIVIDYPNDRLVLTAVRHMETGIYWKIDDIMHIDAALKLDTVGFYYQLDIPDMMKTLSTSLEGYEGYIVRFEDTGHMVKVKGSWYLQMHKTLEHIQHEKDLIRLILDDRLDDAKPFLPADLSKKLDEFGRAMFGHINDYAEDLAWLSIEHYDMSKGSKKEFAARVFDEQEKGIMFMLFGFIDETKPVDVSDLVEFTRQLVTKKIHSNLATQSKVDSVRHLIGHRWEV